DLVTQRRKLAQALAHRDEMRVEQFDQAWKHFGIRVMATVERFELLHLGKGQTEDLELLNELEPANVVVGVHTLAAVESLHRFEESALFVIADGPLGQPDLRGKLADPVARGRRGRHARQFTSTGGDSLAQPPGDLVELLAWGGRAVMRRELDPETVALPARRRPAPRSWPARGPRRSGKRRRRSARSRRELLDRVRERLRADRCVVDRGELTRGVRSAGRAYEDHARRHARERGVLRVVTGAAHKLGRVDADAPRRPLEDVADLRVERGDRHARELIDGRLDA